MATEVIKTIKASGGDYTSIEAFLSGEARDLVAADEIAVAEVYISFDSVALDTSSQAWVTDDTRKIIIRNAPDFFHSGKINQGIKLVTNSGSYFLVLQSGHHMLIEGVEMTGANSASRFIYEPGANLEVKKCLIHDISKSFSSSSGLKLLENCAIWQVGGYVAYGSDITKVVNCSIYANGVGALGYQIILRDCVCYNTVIYNTTTGGYGNFYSCTGDYNASNDTSAPGTNVIDNITLSEIGWTSVVTGSEDLHIGSASLLIDAGIGHNFNSDVPTTDIAWNDRGLDVCAIGTFEFVDGIASPSREVVLVAISDASTTGTKKALGQTELSSATNSVISAQKTSVANTLLSINSDVAISGDKKGIGQASISENTGLTSLSVKTAQKNISETLESSTGFVSVKSAYHDITHSVLSEIEINGYKKASFSLTDENQVAIQSSAEKKAGYSSSLSVSSFVSTTGVLSENTSHNTFLTESVSFATAGQKKGAYSSEQGVLVSDLVSGEKTASHAIQETLSITLATTGTSEELSSGSASISETVSLLVSGLKKAQYSSVQNAESNESATGKKTGYYAVLENLTATLKTTSAGEEPQTASVDVVFSLSTGIQVAGIKTSLNASNFLDSAIVESIVAKKAFYSPEISEIVKIKVFTGDFLLRPILNTSYRITEEDYSYRIVEDEYSYRIEI